MEPLVANYDEAANALRVSRRTVQRLVASRQLGSFKIGARRVIPIHAIEEFYTRQIRVFEDDEADFPRLG